MQDMPAAEICRRPNVANLHDDRPIRLEGQRHACLDQHVWTGLTRQLSPMRWLVRAAEIEMQPCFVVRREKDNGGLCFAEATDQNIANVRRPRACERHDLLPLQRVQIEGAEKVEQGTLC